MANFVVEFDLYKFVPEFRKIHSIAIWGGKCKNAKTRDKIFKHCIKSIKNMNFDKSALKLSVKS